MQKLAYDIDEAAEQCGVLPGVIEKAIDEWGLNFTRIGRKKVILHDELMRWLKSLPENPPPPSGGSSKRNLKAV